MATACELTEDQFLCSICHDVFTEPVTLPCGHNFCRKCLEQYWPADSKCKCPYCKKIFFYRPELKVNIFIAKMAAQFTQSLYKSTRSSKSPAAKPAEVFCDVCTDPKQRAHKSCLICQASYCESHLKPHLNTCGMKKHQLMSRENVSLKKVSEEQRLLLQKTEADIQDKINRRMKKIDELRGSVKVSNDAADRELTDGVKVFTALKETVERGLDLLISEITRKKAEAEQQAEGLIQELEQEVSELEKRGAEVKQLSESDDPLQLFLKFPQLSPEPPTKDWTDVSICPQTHGGAVVRALSEVQQEFNKTTRSLCETDLRRVKTREVAVTLDRGIPSSPTEIPDSANKFVFGKESFSESFYFEAEVRGKEEWTLGVAKEPVKRKGPLTLNPQNGFWTIGLKKKTLCVSDNPKMAVFTKFKPGRVGVFVDYEEGVVSFYDVEAPALIYAFTDFTFTDKLSPFCRSDRVRSENSTSLINGTRGEDFSKRE